MLNGITNVIKNMSENKPNFLEGFKKSDIEKSAKLDIKPRLEILTLGVENAVNVKILTEPYQVEIPKEKAMDKKNNLLWMMNVLYQDIEHQFIAQAGSFRYQLGVLVEKHFQGNMKEIIGNWVKIWKDLVTLETYGEQALYKIALL